MAFKRQTHHRTYWTDTDNLSFQYRPISMTIVVTKGTFYNMFPASVRSTSSWHENFCCSSYGRKHPCTWADTSYLDFNSYELNQAALVKFLRYFFYSNQQEKIYPSTLFVLFEASMHAHGATAYLCKDQNQYLLWKITSTTYVDPPYCPRYMKDNFSCQCCISI